MRYKVIIKPGLGSGAHHKQRAEVLTQTDDADYLICDCRKRTPLDMLLVNGHTG